MTKQQHRTPAALKPIPAAVRDDDDDDDGGAEEQVSRADVEAAQEAFRAVNLDEMVPETLTVAFHEFVPDDDEGFRV